VIPSITARFLFAPLENVCCGGELGGSAAARRIRNLPEIPQVRPADEWQHFFPIFPPRSDP
jgi:hypothetical protein